MSEIPIAIGWQHILAEAVDAASKLPPEWCFDIVKAERVDGALKLSATYVSGDVPLDDHLPTEQKLRHSYRAMLQIRERARAKSLVTCECCGRRGQVIDAGENARVRCARHEYVADALDMPRDPVGYMFDSAEEAMAHLLSDHGEGLDFMQEAQARGLLDDSDREEEDDARH